MRGAADDAAVPSRVALILRGFDDSTRVPVNAGGALSPQWSALAPAAGSGRRQALPTPEQFVGHPHRRRQQAGALGPHRRLHEARRAASDSVRLRELGKSTNGQPFIVLEISAPETLKNLDRYKQLERKLYFQGGAPTDAERDEIFRRARSWCSSPAASTRPRSAPRRWPWSSCIGWPQTTRRRSKKILDNVIFVLVPSLNPDGQIMVTDWFNKNARHRVRQQPDPVPLSPVRRARQQPRHVHVHAEGEPADGEAAVERLVSRRCGSTSTRWAATARASSSCRRPIPSTRTSIR